VSFFDINKVYYLSKKEEEEIRPRRVEREDGSQRKPKVWAESNSTWYGRLIILKNNSVLCILVI